MGRESAGVPPDVHDAADARIRIPMRPGIRSINVAQAAAIAVAEALRQTGQLPLHDRTSDQRPPTDRRRRKPAPRTWFRTLRDRICGAFEKLEDELTGSDLPAGRFERKEWNTHRR